MNARPLALLLSLLLAGILVASLGVGSTDVVGISDGIQGALAMMGMAEPLEQYQVLVELRVIRILATVGVGAALALVGRRATDLAARRRAGSARWRGLRHRHRALAAEPGPGAVPGV